MDIGLCGGSLVVLVSWLIGCVQVRICRDAFVLKVATHGGLNVSCARILWVVKYMFASGAIVYGDGQVVVLRVSPVGR